MGENSSALKSISLKFTSFKYTEVNQREDPREEWRETQQKMLETYLAATVHELQVHKQNFLHQKFFKSV